MTSYVQRSAPDAEGSPAAGQSAAQSAALPSGQSADDVLEAVRLCVDTLAEAAGGDWAVPAGPLTWSCWDTAGHLADDLFAYAVQIGPRTPPLTREVPFHWAPSQPGAPLNAVHADPEAGVTGLLQVLEACGALLAAMVRVTPGAVRAHHVFGRSDAEGFAAMGVVETLVHTDDLARGLGLDWNPPAHLAARALERLFPGAPREDEPWPTLLWATGRGVLPGRERLGSWRWDGRPEHERD